MLNMIIASTPEGGIGYQNKLPWHYPQDLRIFKDLTINHPVIMGRKTYDSLPIKPLPDRINYVLSKGTNPPFDVFVQHRAVDDQYWIIGGKQIYELFYPHVTYIHWTQVNKSIECDTFIDPDIFKETHLVYQEQSTQFPELKYLLLKRHESPLRRSPSFEYSCFQTVQRHNLPRK